MKTMHPLLTRPRHLLLCALLIAFGPVPAFGQQIFDIVGAGISLPGQATNRDDAQVGESFLYPSIGTVDSFVVDAVLTITGKSSGATIDLENGTQNLAVHVFGIPNDNPWMSGRFDFIVGDSSTVSNPFGTPVNLLGVTAFTALDIDSANGRDFTDVFGLQRSAAPSTLGSKLQIAGFVDDNGQPDVGYQYVRAIADNDPTVPLDWTNVVNSVSTDPDSGDYAATWDYANETISGFNFVWGATGSITSEQRRGMIATIEFADIVVIPEPSTALLGALGLLAALRRRR